jgi:hypothetical protein
MYSHEMLWLLLSSQCEYLNVISTQEHHIPALRAHTKKLG